MKNANISCKCESTWLSWCRMRVWFPALRSCPWLVRASLANPPRPHSLTWHYKSPSSRVSFYQVMSRGLFAWLWGGELLSASVFEGSLTLWGFVVGCYSLHICFCSASIRRGNGWLEDTSELQLQPILSCICIRAHVPAGVWARPPESELGRGRVRSVRRGHRELLLLSNHPAVAILGLGERQCEQLRQLPGPHAERTALHLI